MSVCPSRQRELHGGVANSSGWLAGSPYAVSETVFDENDLPACKHAKIQD